MDFQGGQRGFRGVALRWIGGTERGPEGDWRYRVSPKKRCGAKC